MGPGCRAPRYGRPEEGRHMTPDDPGTATRHSRGTQPPTGHVSHSAGPPHPHTRAHSTSAADPDSPRRSPAARGGRAPDLRGPSQRDVDALQPPQQRRTLQDQGWAPHAHTSRARDTRATGRGRPPSGTGGRERDGAQSQTPQTTVRRPQAPLATEQGIPPGGRFVRARGGAGAGSRTPPVPGTNGQRVLAARPQGQAAGRGKAPDARHPSQRRKATPSPPDEGTGSLPH